MKVRRISIAKRKELVYDNGQVTEMDTSTIVDKVVEQLKALPYELQWRVLEFTRALTLSTPHGVPGRQLLHFAGAIPLDDIQRMREIIEQECERIDTDEW